MAGMLYHPGSENPVKTKTCVVDGRVTEGFISNYEKIHFGSFKHVVKKNVCMI